jgi:hypothetical protein
MDVHEVDLLFIDSSHARQATIDEWHAWRPRLAPDALVVFTTAITRSSPGSPGRSRRSGSAVTDGPGCFVWRVSEAHGPDVNAPMRSN